MKCCRCLSSSSHDECIRLGNCIASILGNEQCRPLQIGLIRFSPDQHNKTICSEMIPIVIPAVIGKITKFMNATVWIDCGSTTSGHLLRGTQSEEACEKEFRLLGQALGHKHCSVRLIWLFESPVSLFSAFMEGLCSACEGAGGSRPARQWDITVKRRESDGRDWPLLERLMRSPCRPVECLNLMCLQIGSSPYTADTGDRHPSTTPPSLKQDYHEWIQHLKEFKLSEKYAPWPDEARAKFITGIVKALDQKGNKLREIRLELAGPVPDDVDFYSGWASPHSNLRELRFESTEAWDDSRFVESIVRALNDRPGMIHSFACESSSMIKDETLETLAGAMRNPNNRMVAITLGPHGRISTDRSPPAIRGWESFFQALSACKHPRLYHLVITCDLDDDFYNALAESLLSPNNTITNLALFSHLLYPRYNDLPPMMKRALRRSNLQVVSLHIGRGVSRTYFQGTVAPWFFVLIALTTVQHIPRLALPAASNTFRSFPMNEFLLRIVQTLGWELDRLK